MAKKFTFYGKTPEELEKMSLEDFVKLIPSRMRRSLKRGLSHGQKKLLEKIKRSNKPARTHERQTVIVPEMLGKQVAIHQGKTWEVVDITAEKLGHRLGEFSQTRGKVGHSSPGVGATKGSKHTSKK